MNSEAPDAVREEVSVALHVEDDLRQLAPRVGPVGVVAPQQRQVVEVQLAARVGVGADVDDAARGALLQALHQQQAQVEVPQVVDAQAPLVAVVRRGFRAHVACGKRGVDR